MTAIDDLRVRLDEARAALLAALEGVTDDAFVRPPPGEVTDRDERWAIRDVLWHIGALEDWLRRMSAQARDGRAISAYAPPRRPTFTDSRAQLLEWLTQTRGPTLAFLRHLEDPDLQVALMTPAGEERTIGRLLNHLVVHDGQHRDQILALRASTDASEGALMGTKRRPEGTVPWMPGFRYGALLPPLSLNLLVRDTARSTAFYRAVLDAEVHYEDIDFAALRVAGAEVMLHADHTHADHPWHADLVGGATRGVGLQLRALGELDPDEVAARAAEAGAVIAVPPTDKGHGWREVLVRDPDGYEWAVGRLIGPAIETQGPQPAPSA